MYSVLRIWRLLDEKFRITVGGWGEKCVCDYYVESTLKL